MNKEYTTISQIKNLKESIEYFESLKKGSYNPELLNNYKNQLYTLQLKNKEKLKNNYLIRKQKIINQFKNNPLGFTLNLKLNNEELKTGFIYSVTNNKDTDLNRLIKNFSKIIKETTLKNYKVSGWVDNGLYYLDLSFFTTKKARAIKQAIKFNQLSVYDIKNNKCIEVNN